MELTIEFVRELPIPDYGEWTDAESADWLHPCHGPLPHSLSLFRCLGGDFTVALWEATLSLQTFVDLNDEPKEAEAHRVVGPVPRTYCWHLRGGSFHCSDRKYTPPKHGGSEEAWRRCVCRQIMRESVRLAIEMPLASRLCWKTMLRPASSFPTNRRSR